MKLHEIFKQPVDRPLKGVIIADDNDTLEQEVQEYVVTKEVESRLSKFLDAYNNYEGANGVWISGFFGSGKSHLLKMVALLLENKKINDTSVLDTFLQKVNDEIIRADTDEITFKDKHGNKYKGYLIDSSTDSIITFPLTRG